MAYKVIPVDLSTLLDRSVIMATSLPLAAVSVVKIPVGANFLLHIGRQDGIPIEDKCIITGMTQPEDADQGVYITNTSAQVGVIVFVCVSFQ